MLSQICMMQLPPVARSHSLRLPNTEIVFSFSGAVLRLSFASPVRAAGKDTRLTYTECAKKVRPNNVSNTTAIVTTFLSMRAILTEKRDTDKHDTKPAVIKYDKILFKFYQSKKAIDKIQSKIKCLFTCLVYSEANNNGADNNEEQLQLYFKQ